MAYKDRGDPAAVDFELLGEDIGWVEMDLSAIVPPEGANHMVHLRVEKEAVMILRFRKKGNINEFNVTATSGEQEDKDAWVMCNADRKIEWKATALIINFKVTVRGWLTA